jgi:acetylxylan esterase
MGARVLTSAFVLSSFLFAALPINAQSSSNATKINPHIDGIPSIPQVTDCTDVHIFLAKGNNETEQGQRQLKLVDAICKATPSGVTCGHESIHFDNKYTTVFCVSLEEGAPAGQKQLLDYNKKCPDSKIIVAGYSQGAQVVGDVLGGGGGTFFQDCVQKPNAGLDPASKDHTLGKQIVAVSLCGNTRHDAGQSYNELSGSPYNGLFPRTGALLDGLNKWSNVLHDYCVTTDPICTNGTDAEATGEDHLSYFDVYSGQISGWMWEKMNAIGFEGNTTSSSVTSSLSTSTRSSSTRSSTASATSSSAEESSSATSSTIPTNTNDAAAATASETGAAGSGSEGMFVSLGMLMLPLLAVSSLL